MNRAESIPVYDSARRRIPALEELQEILRYRNLLVQLVRRDILTRYKRSVLGVTWTMLNPLGTMLVMTIVFSRAFSTTQGYSAYVLSGLLAWNFFSQTTNAATLHLVWGGDLLKRIYVPRTAFAISATGTGRSSRMCAPNRLTPTACPRPSKASPVSVTPETRSGIINISRSDLRLRQSFLNAIVYLCGTRPMASPAH